MNKIIIFFIFLFYRHYAFSIYSNKNNNVIKMSDPSMKNLYNVIIISKNSKPFIIRYIKKLKKLYYYV